MREELGARDGSMGFPLHFKARPNTIHDVLEDLGFEALGPVSLECGGHANESRFEGFVTRWKGSAVEAYRRSVSTWLTNHACVLDFDLGRLVRY